MPPEKHKTFVAVATAGGPFVENGIRVICCSGSVPLITNSFPAANDPDVV